MVLYPLLMDSVNGKVFCIIQLRRKVVILSSLSRRLHFPVAWKSALIAGRRYALRDC